MKKIKRIINSNAYLKDLAMRVMFRNTNSSVKHNMMIFRGIDSIEDTESLVQCMVKNITNDSDEIYSIHWYGSDSMHYGHIQNLYSYANIKFNFLEKIPTIEHGINFTLEETVKNMNESFVGIIQGNYMRFRLREINKNVPLFAIGPFIHYAQQYYEDEKIRNIRSVNGRTMLVFPSHTYEKSDVNYDNEKFIEKVLEIYENSYDTLYVCAYWLDMNNKMIRTFKDRGAKIISAGARFDPLFLSRLKTIISLADTVYSNDIGTNIGYCKYLKKPYYIIEPIDLHNPGTKNNFYIKHRQMFIEAFSNSELRNEKIQDELYIQFWGGSDKIKSPNEIESIIKLNKFLIKKTLGNRHALTKNFIQINSDKKSDYLKLSRELLNEALE